MPMTIDRRSEHVEVPLCTLLWIWGYLLLGIQCQTRSRVTDPLSLRRAPMPWRDLGS